MITYAIGDATEPGTVDCPVLIVHVVNDEGKRGAGFSGALSRRYAQARDSYHRWFRGESFAPADVEPFALGAILPRVLANRQSVATVAHLCAQHGVGTDRQRVDYAALDTALGKLRAWIDRSHYPGRVQMPRIGCGLGGGRWDRVEKHLGTTDLWRGVTVLDLPVRR